MSAAGGPVIPFRLGDRLRLSKQHPCGSREWTVVRLGADIGLVCGGCGRRVMLERRELERRLSAFVERGPEGHAGDAGGGLAADGTAVDGDEHGSA